MAKRVSKTAAAETGAEETTELEQAQTEIADYGRETDVEDLTKAVEAATDELHKGGKFTKKDAPAADASDDESDDGGEDDEESDADEEDAGEEADDEGGEEDDDDEADDEDASDAPPAKKKPNPFKRSQSAADASERFLKSVLLDEDGSPTAEAEVIEVSDVLVRMTDSFAKGMGEVAEEVAALQLQIDQILPLIKAMGHHQIQTGKIVKSMSAREEKRAATTPNPGVTHSMRKSMPGTIREGQEPLTKSQAAAGLLAAFRSDRISAEQYKRLAPMLDSQGVDVLMGQLPEAIAKMIRDGAAQISLNGNG